MVTASTMASISLRFSGLKPPGVTTTPPSPGLGGAFCRRALVSTSTSACARCTEVPGRIRASSISQCSPESCSQFPLPRSSGSQTQGQIEIRWVAHPLPGIGHTDDRERVPVQRHRLAQHARVGRVTPLPEAEVEQRHRRAAFQFLGGGKTSAQLPGADRLPPENFRFQIVLVSLRPRLRRSDPSGTVPARTPPPPREAWSRDRENSCTRST